MDAARSGVASAVAEADVRRCRHTYGAVGDGTTTGTVFGGSSTCTTYAIT